MTGRRPTPPNLLMWAKTYNQRYSIGSEGLRFGKYTYARR